jgi:hypothetical protein
MASRAYVHRVLPAKELTVILPLAVVERSPMDEYIKQHNTLEEALKHNVRDALELHNEIELLKRLENTYTTNDAKDLKSNAKKLSRLIIEKEERLFRLIKFSDYPALTMAAYTESKFITSHAYKRSKNTLTDPILIRGISTSGYAKHALENNRDFYFMETGYLGNYRSANNPTGRKIYHRIEKNDMQQNRIMEVPDDRWNALCKFNPTLRYQGWKKPGSKILLIMSTDKPFAYYGHDRQEWIDTTIKTIKQHTDREIVIREKAGRGERTNDTIYDALDDDIYALVTYNSIAAVEAIQYGIPAFSMAPTAASVVSSNDLTQIETPPKPDEELIQKWLWSLAYGQFSLTELLTGEAWRLVLENDSRPTLDY